MNAPPWKPHVRRLPMPREIRRVPLIAASPGAAHSLLLFRYGQRGARPKAYFQASLHADETPGLLVAHHLIRLLDEAYAQGAVEGEIVVAPYANPIGLGQWVNGSHLGRYEQGGAGNFNRHWPDLFTPLVERVKGKLGADAAKNVALIRAALVAVVDEMAPRKPLDSLRQALAREAVDADFVFDLHCDVDALMHLFLIPEHWPEAGDLAAELGAHAVLLAEDSGGSSFDETFSTPWTKLAARFPKKPIPPACLACTVELRGQADVSDELAEQDAEALVRFLRRRGVLAGDPGPLPAPLCEATRFDACDTVHSPAAGVLAYKAALGARVHEGQVIAELVDPAAEDPARARRPIVAATDGLILSRQIHKYVTPGMGVAKVVGTRPLPHRQGGYLLED